MIKIYKKIGDELSIIEQPEKDCWINISPPFNMEQLEQLANQLKIPFSYFVDCIDQYERSRYEKQENTKLIVINTPILNEGFDLEDEATYITIPVGIILIPDIILTVCSVNNPMVEWFEKNVLKNIDLQNRNHFVIKIFERNIFYFLHYLREINKRISQIEKELNYSSRNQELNKLLHLQKALIYFVNDLRADEMVLLKIQRNDFLELKNDEDAKELFQDILIDNSQALEMANVYSNILGNMMGAFASIISNNLGHVVNRLTAVTIALMVPTLIAGIYGMNIDLPFQHQPHAFTIVMIISILVSIGFVVYFRKKDGFNMNNELSTIRIILIFFAGIVVLFLLHLLQELLVPLMLAMFIALLMQPALVWFEKKKSPLWLSVSIIWIFLFSLFFTIGAIIYKTGLDIFSEKDYILSQIQLKTAGLLEMYNRFTGKELDVEGTVGNITSGISSEFIMNNSSSIFGKLGTLFEQFLLTAIYLVLILSGIMKYENYLHYLGGETKSKKYIKAFEEVKTSIVSYMKVKFVISLFYGIGVALICWMFGLQFAFFWGFIGFVLNFLPVFGAIIGLVPVFVMGLIQFETVYMAIALNLTAYAYHFMLASIIEPIFMGSRTSLNTIVVITGLLFWGFLWGIYGMFLSVPMMVLTKVIISQIDGTEVIVRLLGNQKK